MRRFFNKSGKQLTTLFLCTLLIILTVCAIFTWYRSKMNEEMGMLIESSLTSYVASQSMEVKSFITDTKTTMEAIAIMMETMKKDPSSQWLEKYLAKINESEASRSISYISADELETSITDAFPDLDQVALKNLKNDEELVSEVIYSSRLSGYYFALSVPVIRDGTKTGLVRSIIKADTLIRTSQTGHIRDTIHSYLFKKDGEIVPVLDGQSQGQNLFELLLQYNVSDSDIARLKQSFISDNGSLCVITVENGKKEYFVTAELGFNDWLVAGILNENNLKVYSDRIYFYTSVAIILLVALTILTSLIIIRFIRKQLKYNLYQSTRYDLLSKFSDTMLFEYDIREDVIRWSDNACKTLAVSSPVIYNYNRDQLLSDIVHPDDIGPIRELRSLKLQDGFVVKTPPARFLTKDGSYIWCDCQYQIVCDQGGEPIMYYGKVVNITSSVEREQSLMLKASLDSLTGILNSGSIREKIGECVQKHEEGFLFILDIDNFKTINDTMGHEYGNKILIKTAQILKTIFRKNDLTGRIGGDEFAVFMRHINDDKAAMERAENILSELCTISVSGHPELTISVSIGIARLEPDMTLYELFNNADRAMYQSKQSGKRAAIIWKCSA